MDKNLATGIGQISVHVWAGGSIDWLGDNQAVGFYYMQLLPAAIAATSISLYSAGLEGRQNTIYGLS